MANATISAVGDAAGAAAGPASRLASALTRRLVIVVPYLWLLFFFFIPFVIVFKISLSQTAIASPPYMPVLGLGEGGFAKEPPDVQAMQLDSGPAFVAFWNAPEPASMTCEELGTVEAPTLIVTGSETLAAFTEMARAVAACVPKAEAVVLQGVAHGGPIEASDAFGDLALGFIGRQ